MEIAGHGIDVVDLKSFDQLLDDKEGDFLSRCFTDAERLSAAKSADATQHLAGKFAAKEAVAKALGTGFDGVVAPSDIEISTTDKGEPSVSVRGGAAVAAANLRVVAWLLSISHSQTVAVASVIALRP